MSDEKQKVDDLDALSGYCERKPVIDYETTVRALRRCGNNGSVCHDTSHCQYWEASNGVCCEEDLCDAAAGMIEQLCDRVSALEDDLKMANELIGEANTLARKRLARRNMYRDRCNRFAIKNMELRSRLSGLKTVWKKDQYPPYPGDKCGACAHSRADTDECSFECDACETPCECRACNGATRFEVGEDAKDDG